MPVHVFGNPCDIDAISNLATDRNLKVIYDAAHAFGSTYKSKSILQYGDISCTSTHATKIFNTGEGGGLISNSIFLQERFRRLRFFGYDANKEIVDRGTNAKMTEVHAALGIANLNNFQKTINYRKQINSIYRKALSNNNQFHFQKLNPGSNCSYFPIIFNEEETCLSVMDRLNNNEIIRRRYFYPSMSNISFLNLSANTPVADSISRRILCLPSHNQVTEENIFKISSLILKELGES